MNGALPPSSSETFFTVDAHCAISCLPTSVDPVNENFFTSGFVVSSLPTRDDLVEGTTLNTPFGSPARCASSASASAESGVNCAGFTTTVQPAASAGPTLRVIIALGKFHGVTAPTTPIGSFTTMIRRPCALVGITSP